MTDVDPVFRSAFLEWRSGREAWKALVRAVRDERPRAELNALAGAAGVDHGELLDLRAQRRGALAHAEDAGKLDGAKKRTKEARERLERAEKMLNAKNLSIAEQDEARNELAVARVVVEANENAIIGLQVSKTFHDAAKLVGVI